MIKFHQSIKILCETLPSTHCNHDSNACFNYLHLKLHKSPLRSSSSMLFTITTFVGRLLILNSLQIIKNNTINLEWFDLSFSLPLMQHLSSNSRHNILRTFRVVSAFYLFFFQKSHTLFACLLFYTVRDDERYLNVLITFSSSLSSFTLINNNIFVYDVVVVVLCEFFFCF